MQQLRDAKESLRYEEDRKDLDLVERQRPTLSELYNMGLAKGLLRRQAHYH